MKTRTFVFPGLVSHFRCNCGCVENDVFFSARTGIGTPALFKFHEAIGEWVSNTLDNRNEFPARITITIEELSEGSHEIMECGYFTGDDLKAGGKMDQNAALDNAGEHDYKQEADMLRAENNEIRNGLMLLGGLVGNGYQMTPVEILKAIFKKMVKLEKEKK